MAGFGATGASGAKEGKQPDLMPALGAHAQVGYDRPFALVISS